MVLLYMVTFTYTYHQCTPFMLAYIYIYHYIPYMDPMGKNAFIYLAFIESIDELYSPSTAEVMHCPLAARGRILREYGRPLSREAWAGMAPMGPWGSAVVGQRNTEKSPVNLS